MNRAGRHSAGTRHAGNLADSMAQATDEKMGSTCNPGQEKQVQSWTLCCPLDHSREKQDAQLRTA
jgi:hypothetical protein